METHLVGLFDAMQPLAPFDPKRSKRSFLLGMSDDYEIAIGPRLIQRVASAAPGVTLLFRQTNRHLVEDLFDRKELDLAVVADPPRHAWLVEHPIGTSGYACLLDAKRCGVKLPISLEDYLQLPHVLVSYSGRSGIVDDARHRVKQQRSIKASLTHFSALPSFLTRLQAVATLPSHAAASPKQGTDLQMRAPPLPLGTFEAKVVIRRNMAGDAGLQWPRSAIQARAKSLLRR